MQGMKATVANGNTIFRSVSRSVRGATMAKAITEILPWFLFCKIRHWGHKTAELQRTTGDFSCLLFDQNFSCVHITLQTEGLSPAMCFTGTWLAAKAWGGESLRGGCFNGVDRAAITSTPKARTKTDTFQFQDTHNFFINHPSRPASTFTAPPSPTCCLCWPQYCRSTPASSPSSPVWTAFYHILGHPGLFLLQSARSQIFWHGTGGPCCCLLWGHTGELPIFYRQRQTGQWGATTTHTAGQPPPKDTAGLGGSFTCPEVPWAWSAALGRVGSPVVKEPSKTGHVSGGIKEPVEDFLS